MARRPNWTHERRQVLAAEKLRALGLAWRGQPYTAWKKLSATQRAEGVRRMVESRPGYHGGGRNVVATGRRRRQVEKPIGEPAKPIGRVVESMSPARLQEALREGVRRRERVSVYLVVPTTAGPRTKVAGNPANKKGQSPKKGEPLPGPEGRKPLRIRLVFAKAANMPGGLMPADVLALCQEMGTIPALMQLAGG